MRSWFLAIGLIAILAGILMISSSGHAEPTSDYPGVSVAYAKNSWTISANLSKGDFLYFYYTQGAQWRQGLFDASDEFAGFAVLYVGVNVTDPLGNTTMYIEILGKESNAGEEKILNFLDKNITRDGGGIDPSWYYREPSNSYYEVGGAVQYDGTYKFVIGNLFPQREDPPASVDVRKVTFGTAHPLTYLLPSGIVMIGVGVPVTVFGLRKKKKPKSR